MDHRVSKDMISSGMTPSGEKTQADLGKTQYGSAPSPNRLMDAYHSMYQNQKEETLDEMLGKGVTPRPAKRRKQTKSLDQVKADNEARKQKERDRSARARQVEKDIADDIRGDMEIKQEYDKIRNSPEAQKFERDKFFDFQIPLSLDDIDSSILNPRNSWAKVEDYNSAAEILVEKFKKNYAKYDLGNDEISNGGPQ